MNILPIIKKEDSIRMESVQKKQNEFKLIGKVNKVPGLTLFSFNKNTGEIKKADVKNVASISIGINGKAEPKMESKISVEKECVYFQALNKRNAMKKISKLYKS